MSRVMRKILAIEKNSWKNLWKVRNILSIACNVSLDKMPKEVKKERRVLTREEQEKFFTFASSYIHINVLKFAVTTGCRIGEVLGLKWEDCDFEKEKLQSIRQFIIQRLLVPSRVQSFSTQLPKPYQAIVLFL